MVSQAKNLSLIDVVLPVDRIGARIGRDVALIILFSLLTAGFARFSVHLPFTPVPITGQTLVMEYGLYPFIAGDLIKLYVAAITVPVVWSFLNLKQSRDGPWI